MNTRLQVEHPVTECVTGRDLVADQLRIAAGEPLGTRRRRSRRARRGHAIEVRLYAEDAEDGFLPATGRIEALRWPSGDGIRVDAGIEVGSDIGGRFDPMLAKVIAWGPDRRGRPRPARRRRSTPRSCWASSPTCDSCAGWSASRSSSRGDVRTDTLDRIWPPDDWAERTAIPADAWAAAAAALIDRTAGDRTRGTAAGG